MSLTIHHGPNGSFKTSGVVADCFIPAALTGRGVVTNIKGMSREKTILALPEVPESFDLIYINTDTLEGRSKIANWFQWVPQGYLCLFDEAGVVFPKAWTQRDLDKFNHPEIELSFCDLETRTEKTYKLNYIDSAEISFRPANWAEAWQKHRHFNWDIILTAPNIKYIRDDIRQTTEGAYKHRNKALLGPLFSGYKEGYHDAQKNGQSVSDFETIVDKRVPGVTFDLYDSTRTGTFTNTLNGFNLFKSPRVLFPMGIAVAAFSYSIFSGGYDLLLNGPMRATVKVEEVAGSSVSTVPDTLEVTEASAPLSDYESLRQVFDTAKRDASSGESSEVSSDVAFQQSSRHEIVIKAGIKSSKSTYYLFQVTQGKLVQEMTSHDLQSYGYTIKPYSPCKAQLQKGSKVFDVFCHSFQLAQF